MADSHAASMPRSLEDDAKLLDRLQRLSMSILERTRSVNTSVEELARASRVCEVRTRNTLNELLMLCNTQFVENRVYEEEGADPAEEKNVTETKEAVDVKARWEEALTLGVVALRQKVFYDEDEDEEEEAEDVYNSRPLPLIIGTRAYVASDSAGIGAEEAEKDDMEEEYGEEEEDEEGEDDEEEGDAEEEEEEDIYNDRKRDEAPESDVFDDAEVAAEDPEEKMPHVHSDIPSIIAAQAMHQREVRPDDGPKAPPPRAPPPMPESTPESTPDLFAPDDEIFARDDDPYDLFGGKPSFDHPERTDARSLLFGDGGGGLFEDDEEEAPPTSSQPGAPTAFVETSAVKLLPGESPTDHPPFGGGLFGDNDLETPQWEAGATVAKGATKPSVSAAASFEEPPKGHAPDNKNKTSSTRLDDLFSPFPEDGDIFGARMADPFPHGASAKKTESPSTTAYKAQELFDNDDTDDIFGGGGVGWMDAEKGTGDLFGSSRGGLFDVRNNEPADNAGDEGNISGSSIRLDGNASTNQGLVVGADKMSTKENSLLGDANVSEGRTNQHATSSRGLFDNAEDDEPTTSAVSGTRLSTKSGGLFDDEPRASGKSGGLFDDDTSEPLFGRTQPVSSGDGLFDDELDHDHGGIFDDLQRQERKDSVGSELFGGPEAAAQSKLSKGAVANRETGIVVEEVVSSNRLFDAPQAVEPSLARMPSSSSGPPSASKNVSTIPPPMPTNNRSFHDEPKKPETQTPQLPADSNSLFEHPAAGIKRSPSSGLFDEPAESNTKLSRLPGNGNGLFDEPKNVDNILSSQTTTSALFGEHEAVAVENTVSAPENDKKRGRLGQFGDLKIDPTKLLPGAKPPPREHKGESQQAAVSNASNATEPTALMRTDVPESTLDTSTIASRPVVAHGKRRPTTKKKFVTEPKPVVPSSKQAVSPANAIGDDFLPGRVTTTEPQAVEKAEAEAGRLSDGAAGSRGLFDEPRASGGLFKDVAAGSSGLFDDPPFGGSSSTGIFADEPPTKNVTHVDFSPPSDSASKGLFAEEPPLAASKMGVLVEGEARQSFAGQSKNQGLFDEPAAGSNDAPPSELFADEFQKPGFFDDPPAPPRTAAQPGGNSGSLFDEKPASSSENFLDGVAQSVQRVADESSKVGIFDNPPSSSKVVAQPSVTSGEIFDDPQSEVGGLFSNTPKSAVGLFSESANEKGGLFGDDDVGGDNLFSSATPKSQNSASIKKKTGGLFDDDDDLFGSSPSKGGLFG